jgi:glutamate/tyrosine decarboxylase-like PLP-dependent enzyme
VRLATAVRDTTRKLLDGIAGIDRLQVWGDPVMSVFAFGSETIDIKAVGDVMDEKGWHLDRQSGPEALHLMVSPAHAQVADAFLEDLRFAVENHGASKGVEERYSG